MLKKTPADIGRMADLLVTVDDLEFHARLTADNPTMRDDLRTHLPIAGEAARWGDELYVSVPFTLASNTLQQAVPPEFLPTGQMAPRSDSSGDPRRRVSTRLRWQRAPQLPSHELTHRNPSRNARVEHRYRSLPVNSPNQTFLYRVPWRAR